MDAMDAKEILNHLNHLGYRNITAAQLKEFQKDLKKLIRYDAKPYSQLDRENVENNTEQGSVFERLHTETTASYQAKMAKSSKHSQRAAPIDKENHSPNPRNISTAVKDNSETVCKMWIRPKSSHSTKRSDPVELYHSYKKEWNKFKQNLPGENDHSELRWRIRNKLLGE
uniref:HYLS1_C domain-containing protein n=1 Tax=Anopheles coluzzii TaxID=1518534 RepID=A0A6E8VVG9_ANOCL